MMNTNTNAKHDEMRKEAVEKIIETLENGFNGYYCDLHNEVFNTDYYIIGTYQAEKYLKEYGVFNAIRAVQEYEKFNFGELFTDISNPEKLVNMLFYVVGDEIMGELFEACDEFNDNWNAVADDETNAKIIEYIKENV